MHVSPAAMNFDLLISTFSFHSASISEPCSIIQRHLNQIFTCKLVQCTCTFFFLPETLLNTSWRAYQQMVSMICKWMWCKYWYICDPTARNESHWYSVTIRKVTIFDLQVKNIDFWFSSKSGASGIILFENITFNDQMGCFMTVSGILNCNCCKTVVCETNFLNQFLRMELSTVARLIYQ